MVGVADDTAIPVVVAGGLLTAGGIWIWEQFKNDDAIPSSTVNYSPPPKALPGFSDAERVPNRGRARWKLPDGRILEWASQHGDVEVYNKQGKHQGSADPNTGEMTKDLVSGRTTRK